MLMNFKFYVKRFLLSLFLVLASTMLYAQKKADITGTVYDSDGTTPAGRLRRNDRGNADRCYHGHQRQVQNKGGGNPDPRFFFAGL